MIKQAQKDLPGIYSHRWAQFKMNRPESSLVTHSSKVGGNKRLAVMKAVIQLLHVFHPPPQSHKAPQNGERRSSLSQARRWCQPLSLSCFKCVSQPWVPVSSRQLSRRTCSLSFSDQGMERMFLSSNSRMRLWKFTVYRAHSRSFWPEEVLLNVETDSG